MKRNELVGILIKEGFSSKTLVNFTDKQLNTLASRVLSEQTTVPTLKIPKGSPQEKEAMNKKQSFIAYENELKGGQKKLDKNHNGKIDSQDFKILKGQKKSDVKENGGNPYTKKIGVKKLNVGESKKKNSETIYGKALKKYGGEEGVLKMFDKELKRIKSKSKINESNSELNAKRNLQHELSEAGCSSEDLSTKDINELADKFSKKSQGVKSAHDYYKRVTGKDMTKINENLAIKNWVRTLAENNYHSFTSKKEIMNLISEKMNSAETMQPMPAKAKKGHNGIPEFMTYDAITSSSSPSVAPTKPRPDTKPKPGTKPKPSTRPDTPFRPRPQVKPDPEAMKENSPAVAPTKPKTKPGTKPAEPTKPKKTPFRPTPQVQPDPEAKKK